MRKTHIHILHLFLYYSVIQKIFIFRTGRSIASKFCEMKCESVFELRKQFDWSGEKYLFTVTENVGQFRVA